MGAERTNRVVRVAAAPEGRLRPEHFSFSDEPVPEPGEGEVLFKAIYMTLVPSMRKRVPTAGAAPTRLTVKVGDVMQGGPVPPINGHTGKFIGHVVKSNAPGFAPGDFVLGGAYWQTYHLARPEHLFKIDPSELPLMTELGLLGQTSFVAWYGMQKIGKPKPGETVVVSSAGGSIGMVAAQMAKIAGAKVIGIASGEKAKFVVDELGLDACIDRTTGDVGEELSRLAPKGIDVYFENVGGVVGKAAFARMAKFGRYVVCGAASEYNEDSEVITFPLLPFMGNSLTMQGYVIWDHYDLYDEFRREMLGWIESGQMKFRNEILVGFESAPAALADLMEGRNKGQVIIQLAENPLE